MSGSRFLLLGCLTLAQGYLIPPNQMTQQQFHNLQQRAPCQMSPYAKFLSEQEQQTLAELVTEARGQGADEPTVKQNIMKYVGTILSPQRFSDFQRANEEFEANRRGKRDTLKQKPQKVYDFLDEYNGQPAKMYEENTRKLRLH